MMKQVGQVINERINFMMVIKGIFISYLVTVPTFIILALILANTDFPEKFITPAVIVTTIISIVTAGSTVTRKMRSKGWLNGAVIGFIYMLVLYIVSSLVFRDFSIDRYVVTMTVIGILTGSIGGIVGINITKPAYPKHKR